MTAKAKSSPKRARAAKLAAKPATKKAQLIALLRQKGGTDVAAVGRALGWQPHTVRAAFTGLKKAGFSVSRMEGADGVSRYTISGGAA